jgi:hypothetical protein
LVLFFKKEPLSLPLAFRAGDLHTWKKNQKTFANFASAFP